MVTLRNHSSLNSRAGTITFELIVALTILTLVAVPLAFSFAGEQKLCRTYYLRGIAMEIVDGEMEILRTGEWKKFGPGTHEYSVRAQAATNLASGKFLLTVDETRVLLEWLPEEKGQGGKVTRELRLK